MEVRLNPVEFAKSMMKKKKQLIPIPIVLDNGIAGIVYGYYEGEDFYYLDRLDGDVSKKRRIKKNECNGIETRNSVKD
ncbi:hypothetical protein FYJ55_04180 [Holdemanella biformis]|uniref:Uncharacterized protein n=1 Tax=Holdemanella porci TaxID=2652276 RepID=A0A6N7VGT4_9FIRM|nr:hypothetical protein [Holdemanella porci]MSS56112.1 hypothetical protein [Holdemanella porci]